MVNNYNLTTQVHEIHMAPIMKAQKQLLGPCNKHL